MPYIRKRGWGMMAFNGSIPPEAQRGLQRAMMLHLLDPNVSLIDLGLRIRDRQNQRLEAELCVRVHVRRKLVGPAFESFAAQNPDLVIDADRIGFPVDVPQANYQLQSGESFPRSYVFSPMRGGISISNALKYGYGTLGGLVIDRATGAEMILSNWHVLVGAAYARSGVSIYQPGQADGGHSAYTVASLSRHAMDQFIDAAVAQLNGERTLINDQLGIGPVTGVSGPQLGMRVVKSGRRTGVTTGIIAGIEGRQAMYYGGVRRIIGHTVHIAQTSDGGQISAAGDSGSWWLDAATHRAVGLHFAGSNHPEYGLAIAMPQVLDALDVNIAASNSFGVTAIPGWEMLRG
jgi:endonuclease G